MNIINVKVSFEKRTIQNIGVVLTSGDYNSTKLVFEFDKEYEGRKIFELAKPDSTEAIFVKEIINNEVLLVTEAEVKDANGYIKYIDTDDEVYWYDEANNKIYNSDYEEETEKSIDDLTKVIVQASIFDEAGKYKYEISLFGEDSKLTSAASSLKIKEEQVIVNGRTVGRYLPIFDDLIHEATALIENLETAVIDEQERQLNEASRQLNETNRQANELNRETAETNRNSAETNRNTAETNRQNSENSRVSSETARETAETTRSNNEATRQANETTRESNEATRIANDTARESRIANLENNKVDKETGKGLSTNDFTTQQKNKLAELENYDDTAIKQRMTNAEDDIDDLETAVAAHTTQIGNLEDNKADKNELPTKTSDLQNDSNFVSDSSYTHTDNNYTTPEKQKLAGLENYDDSEVKADIQAIENKIPDQATAQNQLADKNFVNSSISTNTAYFRGTYESISELPTTGVTNNDYAFIVIYDEEVPSQVKQYDRYKYNGTAWVYEYTLNNSSFTAAQWAAIQSGITSGLVEKLQGIQAGAEVNTLEAIKVQGQTQQIVDKEVDLDVPTRNDMDDIVEKKTSTDGAITDALEYRTFNKVIDGNSEQGENPSPDNEQPIEVIEDSVEIQDTGKNLLPNTAITQTINGITFTKNNDGSIKINGTATRNTIFNICSNGELVLKAGNYILSSTNNIPSNVYLTINNNGADIKSVTNGNSEIFILNNESVNAKTYLYINNGTTISNLIIYPMISIEGGAYEPYKSVTKTINLQDNFMAKLPNGVKDELHIDKLGNVNLIKKIGKVVLDGSENWLMEYGNSLFNVMYTVPQKKPYSRNAYCNYYIFDNREAGMASLPNGMFAMQGNYRGLFFKNENFTNANDFKQWLSTHNTTVYYELAEPYTVNLGNIGELKTYKGINNIDIIANLDTTFSVEYASKVDVSNKQDKIDNNLQTTSKQVVGAINELNSGKVEKITGKGLSSNDFNNTYKGQLDNFTSNVRNIIPEVLTELTGTAQVNKIYDLRNQSSLTIVLPQGQIGDWIVVNFISGSTPTSLSITSNYGMTDFDLIPEANTLYSLYFEWMGLSASETGWGIRNAEYTKTEVV